MRKTLGVGAVALLVASGCYFGSDWETSRSSAGTWEDPPTTPDRSAGWDDPGYGDGLVVVDARLSGSLGDVRGFDEEPYRVTAFRSGATDVIRLDATDSATGSWVMTEIYVEGGVDDPAFGVGETLSFDGPSGGGVPEGAVFVSGLGCSGPAEMDFAYDEPSQGVDAEVFAGSAPGQRLYRFEVSFPDGSVADLQVELEVPGATGTGEAEVLDASLDGSLDGVAVEGSATWLGVIDGSTATTVSIEQETATGEVLRVRVDVQGGLLALAPGSYDPDPSGDVIALAASTVPFDTDPTYDREPAWIEAHVGPTGDARELVLNAGFESGEELVTTIHYR